SGLESGRQLRHEDTGLSDLQNEAIRRLLDVMLVTAFLLLLVDGAAINLLDVGPAYVALSLADVVALAWRDLRLGVRPATAVLVVDLVGVVMLSVKLFPSAPVFAALVVPVLVASVLLNTLSDALVIDGGTALIVIV